MKPFHNNWDILLSSEFEQPYFKNLEDFLKKEYQEQVVYPKKENIYNALKLCSPENTKVVILGQDPYHQPNQAYGLAFSVLKGTKIPPSLKNIYKEINSDLGIPTPSHGELTAWAEQGVLLLNAVLTVREGEPNSHKNKGWERFTDAVIARVNSSENPVVFLLWGNNARAKASLITDPKHLILQAPHPSPLSAFQGFFGCRHFSKANEFLKKNNISTIDWSIHE